MNSYRVWTMAVVFLAGLSAAANGGMEFIETVPVGDAGNPGDARYLPSDRGSVGYSYAMGKFEISAMQYTAFLNSVAQTDTYGLYNENMWSNAQGCKIERTGVSGSYVYDVAYEWSNRPVNYVSWGSAARFANWMHNGMPTGNQDLTTTEDGSYYLNGATSGLALASVTRQPDADWVIPNDNEWYKAAFYDPNKAGGAGYWNFATRSDTAPGNGVPATDPGNTATFHDFYSNTDTLGSPYYRTEVGDHENSGSGYGTFDQNGNVWEWMDRHIIFDDSSAYLGVAGGGWDNPQFSMHANTGSYQENGIGSSDNGFRLALVPEPASLTLLALAGLGVLRRKKA